MNKSKRTYFPSSTPTTSAIATSLPKAIALSAHTVARRGEVAVPNRALALLERDGDTWRFVRAHLWFEAKSAVASPVRLLRSRP